MTKITPEHLVRDAVVYVRQSTAFQVAQNLESQRRQYGLTGRARQLGWPDVAVIDDDLGRGESWTTVRVRHLRERLGVAGFGPEEDAGTSCGRHREHTSLSPHEGDEGVHKAERVP